MTHKFLIALSAALALAGCDIEGAPQSTSPAASPQRDVLPAPQVGTASLSDTSTTTTTTVSGNTTRTETTSTSVGVNAGGLLGALAGGGQAANTAADYVGAWTVTSPNNRQCRLVLRAPANASAPAMVQNQGCFQELFGVNRWSLRGSELVLTDAFGKQLASLRATERNRLEGGGVVMSR